MYEYPASIAPEPNNCELISSRSFFFLWLAEQRIHCWPDCTHTADIFAIKNTRSHEDTQKLLYLVFHVSPASVIVVFIYSGVCGLSPQPVLLIVCQSSPEAEGRRLPSPSRRLLAADQNRKLSQPILERGILERFKRSQSEHLRGGATRELQIQLKHSLEGFSSDSEFVPMATALFQLYGAHDANWLIGVLLCALLW